MSALLTTTMPYMGVVIKRSRNRDAQGPGRAGRRRTAERAFAEEVEADAYCRDAAVAVETAKKLLAIRGE